MTGAGPLTLGTVVGAALVDSLNPCAFALLLVFVATNLTLASRSVAGARLLPLGGLYLLGIFLTYLALGLGLEALLRSARVLAGGHVVARAAAWVAIGLGILTLQEALLPEWGTRLAARVDVQGLKVRFARGGPAALFGAGVLVGLCTVPCSGSVYLGVLALLSAGASKARALALLLVYNLVFVAPLAAVLVACCLRPVHRALARWQLHHRTALKLSVGLASALVGLVTLAVV